MEYLDPLSRVFSSEGFIPRRLCGLWPEWLVWEHVTGNALVWISYIAMPLMIWRLGVRREDWAPFRVVVRSFALFILLCGLGHFLEMLAFFRPVYRLSGHVLVVTGLVSGWTAWTMRRAWPAIMAMKSPTELERIIAERTTELAMAHARLGESEERQRRALSSAKIGLWEFDVITRSVIYHDGLDTLFGCPGATSNHLLGSIHPDDFGTIMDAVDLCAAGLAPFDIEFRVVWPDGSIHWLAGKGGMVPDGSEAPVRLVGLNINISERKRAEEQIRRLNEDLERRVSERTDELRQRIRLIDQAHDAIIIRSREGRISSWNQGAQRLYGWTSEEAVGRISHELLKTRFPTSLLEIERELDSQGTWEGELNHERRDGVRIIVASRKVVDRDGSVDGAILEINSDITERLASEEALRRSEAALRASQRLAGIGTWEWDPVTDVVTWTDELYRMAGRDPSLPAPSYNEHQKLYTPSSLVIEAEAVTRALETGEPYEIELEMIRGDGVNRWIAARGEAIKGPDGQVAKLWGTALDITARKQFEETLRVARDEAMAATRAKGDFLANMSHEIRTPMNGVIGMTELLLETRLDSLQRGYAETIRSSGDALLTVINDILDLSKIEARKLTIETIEFDLREVMAEVTDLLAPSAHQKGLEINGRVAPEVPARLLGDPARVRQVLTNLAGNAVKFTSTGEVNLEARPTTVKGNSVTLRITVQDTGIGIPEDRQAEVFESFTQLEGGSSRRFGGTGLGLAISRSLVELMSGSIGVESTPGLGSTFWFDLPLGRLGDVADNSRNELQGLRVLLADDHESSRVLAGEMLRSWGCRPDLVGSGAEALTRILASPQADPYQLVILDQNMPGLDGDQTAQVIRADSRFAKVPLLLVTSPGAPVPGVASRFNVTITKPVSRSKLLEAIGLAIDSKGASERSAIGDHPTLAQPSGVRVLMADDNEVNRRVALGLLHRLGCSVDAVENGREALETLDYGRHDLILMDVQMPEMDGLTATAAIREREKRSGRHIPIIAMTAHAMRGDREKCLQAGMDDYIAKPLRTASLQGVLVSWAAGRARPGSTAN